MEIGRRRAARLQVLNAIYNISTGSESATVGGGQLLEDLGMSDQEVADACDWLEGEHFVKGCAWRGVF